MNNKNNTISIESPGVRTKTYNEKFIIKLIFSFTFAILMAVSANSFVYLPFTPVPITMQTLTVLLSSILLGSRWAALGQLEYILMGIAGLPVFAGGRSGLLAIAGPTGGYIIGFVFASFAAGYIYENPYIIENLSKYFFKKLFNLQHGSINTNNNPNYICQHHIKKENTSICFISCITGIIVIYFFGYVHLLGYLYSFLKTQNLISLLVKTWNLGIQPFIIVDLLKILIILNIEKLHKIKK